MNTKTKYVFSTLSWDKVKWNDQDDEWYLWDEETLDVYFWYSKDYGFTVT